MHISSQRVAALHRASLFNIGDVILYGKWKNKRGRILRIFTEERGVPMIKIEPIPKGRKKNREMGLYNIWHLPERRMLSKQAAFQRSACIIAGRTFGDRLCLLKNRDRSYDATLQIIHMQANGVEMAVVFDTVTGYMEGVNEFGIGVVNTTLMVMRDEQEGKTGPGKAPMRSKDGPKIYRALAQRNLDDAVKSLVSFRGGIRGHSFVADGKRIFSIECTRTHPARVHELDPQRVNTRTNHGISYPDAGYTHGDDYVSSLVRRWEAQKRLQDVRRPEAAAVALIEAIHDADSAFNPVRVTDHMRTTSQLTIDTTNPALWLYLIPGHAEVKNIRNMLPEGREPKIPVKVFRYKAKMEDREPPKLPDKTATRESLDVAAIEKLRKDFLLLMKNVGVVKNYDQAVRWKDAVRVWNNRFNHVIFEQLTNKEFRELARGGIITPEEAAYWKKKVGKECWSLYLEFRVPLSTPSPSGGHYSTPEYLFADMERQLPKWKPRVERAARQAWTALKEMVTWFANHRKHPMSVEIVDQQNENMEGFQVSLRGITEEFADPGMVVESFKEGLRLYKQRARAVLPVLLQSQLPLVLDFTMGFDAGGQYHGTYISVSSVTPVDKPEKVVHVLAHEMGHHIYKDYLSQDDRKFWSAAITGNYGRLDLNDVLRKFGSDKEFLLNDRIRVEDPIMYLQIEGLLSNPETERIFERMYSMDDLRAYLAGGGKAMLSVHGKPITGYASKNDEEAFCEAIGMLVGYGPRAVLPEVREWLKTILPSLKVASVFNVLAKARFKSKKKVKTKDGDEMIVYEYGPRQVANRNNQKAERIEGLRTSIGKLRTKVKTDLKAEDEKTRATALAVALMDETYERVGNNGSADDGHFGVTTWQAKHVKFSGGKATITYVGKSGVDQKKTVKTKNVVEALRAACKGKKGSACVIDIDASAVNEYLKPFDITAKDLRGFHANREMKERLKQIRKEGPSLPGDRKEKDALLKKEFKKALDETAKAVGHTGSTLRSQYLVPGLEDDYVKDGTVNEKHTKTSAALRPTEEKTLGGRIFTMPLKEEMFIHFTPSERALEILKSKTLKMSPPYQKSGIDAITAISATYGEYVPTVQTQHIKSDSIVALLFSTNTMPKQGWVEEVIWKHDVALMNPKLLPMARAVAMLRAPSVRIGDQDMVRYTAGTHREEAPSVLRTAAQAGTPMERRMLATAMQGPVFAARDRRWWLTHAPNIYRIAREHERPRPAIEGLSFPTEMFATLWYEDEDGERIQYDEDFVSVPPGAHTQHSQFPNVLQHTILVMNDDGSSSSLGGGSSSFPTDLVTAMVRSGEWDVADAVMVAGQSCERCLNVLCHHYGLDDGYPFASEQYWTSGTCCDMCRDLVGDPHVEQVRLSTKTRTEIEDEQVQKMLRKEPKKKPPRYDLRDNRTLKVDDPDLEGLGGGDDGDRDMSLKWNKVASRVVFRWLALPRRASSVRLALRHTAKNSDESEFQKAMEGKKFRNPESDKEVAFKSLPPEEQERHYERWLSSRSKAEEDATEETEADEELEGDSEDDESEPKSEKDKEIPRTKEDVRQELGDARERMGDLDADIATMRNSIVEAKENIVELKKLLDKASEQNKATINENVKNEKETIRQLTDALEDKTEERQSLESEIASLKKEQEKHKEKEKAPKPGQQQKPGQPANPEDEEKRRKKRTAEAIKQTQKALQTLAGSGAKLSKEAKTHIEEVLADLDDDQAKEFAETFQRRLGDLASQDPTSGAAVRAANQGANIDLSKKMSPDKFAEQLATMSYAFNVVANPMVIGGTPVGQTAMTDGAYGQRAQGAFEQFRRLNKKLRSHAAEQITARLRDLEEDSDEAQELQAILTGIDVAQIAETGEALPGRPQPSKGNAALIRKLVENGQAASMFGPVEDFFSETSRKAMTKALDEMDDAEVASFILGDSGDDHPFAPLREALTSQGASEYKQMIKGFLIQDFLNDTWGDRAARDIMQGAGVQDADDPEARAKLLQESKARPGRALESALEAMERVNAARAKGGSVDPADAQLVQETFEGEAAVGLIEGARNLLQSLTKKFKKKVISPAIAVLNHFVTTGDASVLQQEVVPHPDANAPNPRGQEDREEDRSHEPGDVWKTEEGNWRAKNSKGVPHSFEEKAEADRYAAEDEQDDFSADFNIPVDDRGPSRFAVTLAQAWVHRIMRIHPDDPARPVFVEAA